LYKKEEDMEQESSRLYEKLKRYYQGLVDAIEELLPIWEKTMKDINEKYEFE
jgi:hypothetical protein